MIPWGAIVNGALGVANFFIRDKERREELRKQMIQFIKRHDESVALNSALRKEYEKLLAAAEDHEDEAKS